MQALKMEPGPEQWNMSPLTTAPSLLPFREKVHTPDTKPFITI